jgi:DNA polymerase elongation subunit (family B)
MKKIIKGNNFECRSLGVIKETVYDLEVENTHTFFANDILVHNSTYLNMGPLIDKFFPGKTDEELTNLLDKMSKEKFQPFINKCYEELKDYMNGYAMEWFMKREAIASTAVFVQKKRYFMHILDDEGVRMKVPKLKVTGLEAVRSSTPEICRDALKGIMSIILDKDEKGVQKEVEEFRKRFFKADIIDICFSSSVSDIEKWESKLPGKGFKSRTPIAVKSAIMFNKTIQKKDPTYGLIKSGDKIKYCYLNLPNKYRSPTMGLPNELPKSLGLVDKDVDKDLQYVKTYLNPVDAILKVIGWDSKKVNKLSSFFS